MLFPRYAGRPWKTTKPIVVAWLSTLVFVATAYRHHLYMDFVQPDGRPGHLEHRLVRRGAPGRGRDDLPGDVLVWGSRYRWTLASTLLYLGFTGWAIGGTGAVIDSFIPINFRLHNTLWVPAHFHTYLLLAVILWAFAFLVRMLEETPASTPAPAVSAFSRRRAPRRRLRAVGTWFVSGTLGVPRR